MCSGISCPTVQKLQLHLLYQMTLRKKNPMRHSSYNLSFYNKVVFNDTVIM